MLDFFEDLCPDAKCTARRGEVWLYRDSLHVSVAGSELLASRFAETVFSE